MKEFADENRVNAVNFIELNILLSQTIDIIDPMVIQIHKRSKLIYKKLQNA